MYANYFLINEEFLSLLQDEAREKLSSMAYSLYRKCCNKKTKILSKQNYFSSKRTHYPIIFFCCPKCKASMIAPMHGFKTAHGLKYCPHCGEPSIDYRFNTGIDKVLNTNKHIYIFNRRVTVKGIEPKHRNFSMLGV